VVALLAGLPWWGWVLLVVLGLVVGAWWAIRRAPAAEPDDAAADPDAPALPSASGP
jgi:hypothetical protein